MDFKPFAKAVSDNVSSMMNLHEVYKLPLSKGVLKEVYNNAFPAGTNDVFVKKRVHDCSCCNSFLGELGSLVVIDENFNLKSVWELPTDVEIDPVYKIVAETLDQFIKNSKLPVVPYFRNKKYGSLVGEAQSTVSASWDTLLGTVITHDVKRNVYWNHFNGVVNERYLVSSVGEAQSTVSASWDTLLGSIEETSLSALDTVLELMEEKQLDKSAEFEPKVQAFKAVYEALTKDVSDLNAEQKQRKLVTLSQAAPYNFKNSVIGTLVVDIANNVDLDTAVAKYHHKVSPNNFKRSSKIVTASMKKAALDTFESLGYSDSLARRFATVEDVSVNNMMYVNRDTSVRMKDSLTDLLSDIGITTLKKPSKNILPISISEFMQTIVPTSTELEIFVESKFKQNLVSLIAPAVEDSKPLLKWNNNFSWAFNGDVTSKSIIAKSVEEAGGKLKGVLRFSLIWNTELKDHNNDLDIHAIIMSNGRIIDEIYFGDTNGCKGIGNLDVDNTNPGRKAAVENIIFDDLTKLDGLTIKLVVNNFSGDNLEGFSAEIVFNGETHDFNYNKSVGKKENVVVAEVAVDGSNFKLTPKLSPELRQEELWGIKSGTFAKVSAITNSPNYWDGQAVGTEHLFFMLDQCVNPNKARGLYSEFVSNDLYQHRALLEVVGNRLRCNVTTNQLSGLGFSVDDSSELLIRATTKTTKRIYKVKL